MKKQLHNLSLKTLMFVMLSMAFIINGTPTQAQYCTPPHTSATPCISSVVFATINNATPTTCAVPSYTNYPTSAFTAVLTKGMTYNMNVVSTGTSANKVSVWIDYNQNQVYEASEWTRVYDVGQSGNVNITIPPTALSGNTGMRIRVRLASSPNEATDACTSFGGGESEDYTVTIIDAFPCTAPPTAGVTTASSTFICPNTTFNLGLQGNQFGSGLSYQWQSSPDSIAWTNMTGFTSLTATAQVTSAPMYYRCELICSSVPAYSTPVKVRPRSLLPGGTYTLNASLPNSSTNFNSFAEFNSAINCGISGPIALNVTPGTYVGTLSLVNLSGTSSINTVTINGHGAKLIDTLKTGKPDYILQIRGTNYVTVDSMILEAHSTSTKGYVVSMGDANYNTIKNCKIIGDNVDITNAYFGAIIVSGATNSYTVATTARYNTIENNEISGGYLGVVFYGTTTIANMKGNIIRNNIVRDFGYYGIYIYGTDSTQITGNDIHRKTRSVVATANYNIYSAGAGQQISIRGNKIHDLFPSGSSATFYGIYHAANDGIVGKENIIANNTIYNVNTTGSQYCIYNSASDHWKYYYNTVYVENPNASAGLCYGFYQITLATGIELKNNIFSINKGGSGAKYCLYFSTATTLPNTDYNDLYVNTSVSGTGVKNIAYHSAARVTLADWKAYTSNAYDQNSMSEEPAISGAAFDDLTPNAAALNNVGTAIASVVDDITGAIRSSTPDIGAYEFSPANDDAGISAIVSPKGVCPGLANVEVRVKNYGISTMSSVTVNWSVNGVAQTPYVFIGSVNSGADTLLGIGSFNVIANAPYNIKIWTSAPNSSIDANPVNDTVFINGLKSGLVGTITVGGSGADFASLEALSTFLSLNGVCGPTTVNVNSASGPYTTGISLQNVTGLSSTNTLVIHGNGTVINTLSNGISLNKVNHVTIDSFVVNVNGSAGLGIHIMEGDYNTIKSNTVNISQDKTATSYSAMALSGSSSSATTAGKFRYNIIENNTFRGGYYLLSIYGNTADLTSAVGNVVRNNKILDGYVYSLYSVGADSLIVENNDINRSSRTLNITTFYGSYFGTGTRNLRYRNNKIHSPFPVGSVVTSASYLMYISADATPGNENIFYNNAAYNIGGSGSVYCMYSLGSDGAWYHNNTIDIGGSGAGLVYGAYQTTAATNCQFINNSININRVNGTGTRIGIYYATTGSTITSNYNHVSGGGIYGQYGTTTFNTLSDWKTANSGAYDQNSIDGDPMFNGIKNVVPKAGSVLVGAGTPLANVTTDLMGVLRNSATPTIGAYESAGDFSGPSITFTPILNTLSTSNYTLNNFAAITDASVVDTTTANRPRLYYKLSTGTDTYNDNTSATAGWKYVTATNTTSPFSFVIDYSKLNAPVAVASEIQYFVVAQDLTGFASVNAPIQFTNDLSSVHLTAANFPLFGQLNSYKIATAISGTFVVGSAETYKSLTGTSSIFEYINNNILSGDINIVVKTSLFETGAHPLNAFGETGPGGYKITIRPNADTLRTISGSYAGGLIRLNGTKNVIIDGSFNGSGKYLKFENASATTGTAGIQLISLGNNAGVNNVQIKNSIVMAGTAGNAIPIHIGGLLIPYSPGASNNKIKIINNTIMRGSVGIYSGGEVGYEPDSLVIEGNTIGSDVTAEQLRLYGIALEVQKNAIVNNNTIKNIINTAAQQSWGVAVYDGFLNGRITNNKIEKVAAGAGAFGGRGIEIIANRANDNITVANNFIGNITGGGSAALNSTANVGISMRATGGVKLYYNSISLSGNISQTTGAVADVSAALHVGVGSRLLDIRNNSIYNTLTNTSDTSFAYALYSEVGDTAYSVFNYNNFYAGATQGKLGYMNGTDLLTMSDIMSATSKNVNSINLNPNYNTAIDLHAQGVALYQKGTPIAGITTDIDGDTRSITLPCIGADEFLPPLNEVEVLEILYPKPNALCGITNDSIVLVVQNLGRSTQTNINVGAIITGVINTTLSSPKTINLPPNGRDTITLSAYNSSIATGDVKVKVYAKITGDAEPLNDTAIVNTKIYAVPANPAVSILTPACSGGSAVLFANTPASVSWYTSPAGGTLISTNDTLTTGALSTPTTYYAEATTSTIQRYSVGPVNTAIGAGALTNLYTYQVLFTVNNEVKIDSIAVFPSGSGVVGIRIRDGANTTTLHTMNFTITAVSGDKVFLPLNLTLPPGDYRIDANTGTTNVNLFRNTAGSSYPYTASNNSLVLTGHTFSGYPQYHYYFYDWKLSIGQSGCPSDRVAVTVVPTSGPAGSGVAQSTPFDGVFNAGTLANADGACVGDVLTYSLVPPTGFNLAGLGTTWNIINPTIKTLNGATPVGAVTMSGISLQYTASAGDKDSTLVFTAKIRNLSTGCDTLISRYLNVSGTPSVSLGTDQNICEGTVLTLDAGTASSYLWSTGATTQTIQVTTAGTYTVEIKNASGCEARDTIVVTTTTTPTANLGPDASSCVGTPITLDAGNPGSTYLWNTGATTQTIQANASGIYIVTVTGNGGCFDTDTIQLNFNALPVVSIGADAEICTSDTITLDAGNVGSTYLWSTGATTQTIRVSDAGTYSVTVTNGNGCVNNDAIVITNKAVPVSSYSIVSSTGQSITFQATITSGLQYSWNFGDPTSPANTSQLASPTHVFTSGGVYTVTLTVTNVATGCRSTTTTQVTVTGLGNDFADVFKLGASPNPFAGETKIKYVLPENANSVTVEVYDMLGRKVSDIKHNEYAVAGEYVINYKNEDVQASSGVYMIRLTVDGNVAYIRVVDIAKQ